jgi:hypothetical protein
MQRVGSKRIIRSVTFDECRALLRRVARFRTTNEIETEMDAFLRAHGPVHNGRNNA